MEVLEWKLEMDVLAKVYSFHNKRVCQLYSVSDNRKQFIWPPSRHITLDSHAVINLDSVDPICGKSIDIALEVEGVELELI